MQPSSSKPAPHLVAHTMPQLMSYFHTGFRNVGVATSLALLALAARRFYHDKDHALEYMFLAAALAFMVMAVAFAINVYRNVDEADRALVQSDDDIPASGKNSEQLSRWLALLLGLIAILTAGVIFIGWLIVRIAIFNKA